LRLRRHFKVSADEVPPFWPNRTFHAGDFLRGMRYQYQWQDLSFWRIPAENQANVEACIHRALELGINHIETARGYGTSEVQLGRILPRLPREKLIVQTKVGLTANSDDFAVTSSAR